MNLDALILRFSLSLSQTAKKERKTQAPDLQPEDPIFFFFSFLLFNHTSVRIEIRTNLNETLTLIWPNGGRGKIEREREKEKKIGGLRKRGKWKEKNGRGVVGVWSWRSKKEKRGGERTKMAPFFWPRIFFCRWSVRWATTQQFVWASLSYSLTLLFCFFLSILSFFFLFLFLNALIARKFDPVCFWISDLDSLGPDFGRVVSGVEWKG